MDQPTRESARKGERLADGLGWLSVGLGVAQVAAPHAVERLIGLPDGRDASRALRAIGLRELLCAGGILMRPQPGGWLWARVAGDMMDLALLTRAARQRSTTRTYVAMGAVAGVLLVDLLAAVQVARGEGRARNATMRKSITIGVAPEEVYRFWRDLQNLPRFLSHLAAVQPIDERRSHWVLKAAGPMRLEWNAEIVEDRPGQYISWRTIGESALDHRGFVQLKRAPGDQGTEVHVEIRYDALGGSIGAALAKLGSETKLAADLLRLKQILELGEVVHSDASIHRGAHAARPAQREPRPNRGASQPERRSLEQGELEVSR